MNPAEKRVLEAIDFDAMYDFIEEIIATPSFGGEESKAQLIMAAKLEELGLTVDQWEIDFTELRKHPDFSMSYEREEGLGVVGITGLDNGKSIILCGHIDTVAPGDIENWDTIPLKATLKDGKLYGRGTTDMKAALIGALYALKAVKDTVKLKGKVIFESVIGEEDGGCGALATCLRGYKADAGIVMEPSETKVAPEVAGAMSFKIIVPGKPVHACVKDEGISAIEKFIVVYNGLMELEKERNKRFTDPLYNRYESPYAISIGTVHGGEWPGTVAESVVFEGRIGVAVGEKEESARRELEEKIDEIADGDPWLSEHRPKVEWVGYSFASSMVSVDHPIVQAIGKAYRDVTGKEPMHEGMTYASDVRHLIKVAETPTTVFGPGDVRVAHGANEYVPIDELETVVKTLALTIMRFVGYEE
ncbi:acetylornithine deacetylase [Candidatus Bathyarchaeota archaeon]|nr:MAG: acetylornithine deacetylase [Candidatus Bathyarchaeota archaeon]